ncbi:MAG: site-specific DNA-methyltransferase [Lentisphaerae bacterium]|nr:site-specific DNA-methyltransferase [Lentisphaerota bacterium]
MPSVEQLRNRLIKKLSELFRLDQPDLDFGFYRIMQAKAQEIKKFIDIDLLNIVADAFGDVDEARKAELQKKVEDEIKVAEAYGVPDPENSPKVKEAQAIYEAIKDTASAEADVYDHLYRFFERYYDNGDFITRRYYTRETSGRAAPFAVPYNGEEVKLHWANADQYYIKTAEYFSNFTFDLTQSAEVRKMSQEQRKLLQIPNTPRKVHFRVVEGTEGEHGNIKATEDKKRFFILHETKPLEIDDAPNAELFVNFEYRADPEKTGQDNTWRDKRNAEAVDTVLTLLDSWAGSLPDEYSSHPMHDYLRLLTLPAPTESDKKRPLLAKYVTQYTARNTMDYFIHKDLGGFLRRELDFYIKNEVMHLDDIENASAPAVESYLGKVKVLRKIAHKLIDFLAQLEDFQKKLWLKKKFVVETNYCITLDRVPEKLYPEVAANEAQCEEWIKLFSIDEIKGDLVTPEFSRPLTVELLKANDKLVLDTRFFDDDFKARLIASIDNFDEQCDGLLLHSENFQALNLLQERYREQVKCVYIDPPYNTKATPIIYKNEYKHSSWNSLIYDRLVAADKLTLPFAFLVTAIDHAEIYNLGKIKDSLYGEESRLAIVTVQHNPKGRNQSKFFSENTEYLLFYGKDIVKSDFRKVAIDEDVADTFESEDEIGKFRYENFIRARTVWSRKNKPNNWYPIYVSKDLKNITSEYHEGYYELYPRTKQGDFSWKNIRESFDALNKDDFFIAQKNGDNIEILHKYREQQVLKNLWIDKKYQSEFNGTNLLKAIVGPNPFDYPKSLYAVLDVVKITTEKNELVLDYFAGSGTTGHAVIELNREDGGKRKYILIEIGNYFDTVLKPRIAKVVYSENWKDGKPTERNTGVSHCFKYLRLESYEDTLNNLRFDDDPQRKATVAANASFKEDYMLHYLLDVETRGSQSLLNIDKFADPTAYTLNVKKPGTDEYAVRPVDLIETFNYLIGLRVQHTSAPQTFQATFKRSTDQELPKDQHTRLMVDGRIRQNEGGPWWFRKVEGWVPMEPTNPNNGKREKVLIVWRKLTDDIEQDNLMLDEWFQKNCISTRDFEFDTIYVNGSNNLPNLKRAGEKWKVRLIEEEFMKRMWNAEGI